MVLLAATLFLVACGSNTAAPNPVTVVIFPLTASINVKIKTQFVGVSSGGDTGAVNWLVNGTKGGDATDGTIDATGLYTAPPTVPTGGTVTITAQAADDTTVEANATLTILAAAQVTVSPPMVSQLAAGATAAFTSTVIPAPSPLVTWEVNSIPGGSASFGFITPDGIYTAPASPAPGGMVTVTAVSQADSLQSGSATVTETFSTASFKGTYSFTMSGKNAAGAFVRAGRFVADGSGGLSGGVENVNALGAASGDLSFTGIYSVGPDGRGSLQFIGDGLARSQFRMVLDSNRQAQIISFDAAGTATGEADLQDNTFLTAATLVGTYVFDVGGQDAASKPISEIGEFFADGNGGIHNGQLDINDNGVISSDVLFTGSYTINSATNGHGTAQFVTAGGTLNFSIYIVSRSKVELVQTDSTAGSGAALQQEPSLFFSTALLNGSFSFLVSGANAGGQIATAGNFSALGNGVLAGGVLDENSHGAPVHELFAGSYSVDATGRGTATFNAANRTYTFVFYLTVQFNSVLQETDSAIVSDGVFAQLITPLSAATLPGSYSLSCSGVTAAGAEQRFTGQFGLDGNGNVTSGTIDLSTFSAPPGSLFPAQPATGGLAISTPASGGLALTTPTDVRNFGVYATGPGQIFGVETESGPLSSCSVLKQF